MPIPILPPTSISSTPFSELCRSTERRSVLRTAEREASIRVKQASMIRMQKEVDAQRVQGRYEEEADRQRRNALKRQRDDSDNAVVVALERKRRQHMLHQNIVRLRENNGAAISGNTLLPTLTGMLVSVGLDSTAGRPSPPTDAAIAQPTPPPFTMAAQPTPPPYTRTAHPVATSNTPATAPTPFPTGANTRARRARQTNSNHARQPNPNHASQPNFNHKPIVNPRPLNRPH
jgi:hypothetical protein